MRGPARIGALFALFSLLRALAAAQEVTLPLAQFEALRARARAAPEHVDHPVLSRSALGSTEGPEQEFEAEARLLLALKLYETGRLSTGLAAQLAGVPRVTFLFLLGQHGLSPFGEEPEELEGDLADARRAGRSE